VKGTVMQIETCHGSLLEAGEAGGATTVRETYQPLEADLFLQEMSRGGLQEVEVAGRILRPGSRVRLNPRPGGDLLDSALAGRVAIIEGIDEDDAGVAHVAVIMEDDPGRGLGPVRHPAHRFFFAPGELEPLEPCTTATPQRRVLVAGIGNLFLGDDGFGVCVAQRLMNRALPAGVEVIDFGIRGMDLAYALGQAYHAAILVDAVPGSGHPGTLVVMEAEPDNQQESALDGHRMDPLSVLRLARRLGPLPERVLVVGCHPEEISEEWTFESAMRLSTPVAAAVEAAADLVEKLAAHLMAVRTPVT
jgi:hydrogenase maturation protease